MISTRNWLCRFAAVLIAQHFGLCAQAAELRHDVFARPALPSAQTPRLAPAQAVAPAQLAPAWRPEVRAIVVAGRDSLADVDGTIVRIGGEIDGFRLVEVREQEVVFVKNKNRYTLGLRGVQSPGAAPGSQNISTNRVVSAAPEAPSAGNVKAAEAARESPATGSTTIMETTRGPQ